MSARVELVDLLERMGDEAADAAWLAGVAALEKAALDARAALEFRWRSYPRGELRALRRNVKQGLALCRLAMLTAEADRERFEVDRRLAEELAEQARRAKRVGQSAH